MSETALHTTGLEPSPEAPAADDDAATSGSSAAGAGSGRHEAAAPPRRASTPLRRVAAALSFRNVSAAWVLAAMLIAFTFWIPDLFWTAATLRSLLDQQALTVIVALGLVVPLSAGAYDLSIGATIGISNVLIAWQLGIHGISMALAIPITLAAMLAVGLLNGLLVTRARIDSFVATLAVGSILTAMITYVSGGQNILGLSTSFQSIATAQLFGVSAPAYYALGLALILWYVLERTPFGRRIYATGGNPVAAGLVGISTRFVITVSLMICSLLAGFVGLLLSSRLGDGSPTIGPDYLLPAFAAAFLGSTQIRNGRFNVWGTILAVIVLAVGVKGLQLAGAPFWLPNLFNGVALILAVGLSRRQRGAGLASTTRWARRRAAAVS